MNTGNPGPELHVPVHSPWWWHFFRPDPPSANQVTDPAAVAAGYRRWRFRVLVASIIGYAAFYFVRKNLSVAMPDMEKDLGLKHGALGVVLTIHGVLYGVSKFANGILADRCNARAFMVVGLVASAVLNVFCGLSSTIVIFGIFWLLNGWVQGMGFPPCARLLTHWFSPRQLPMKMSIWNTSHSLGAVVVVVLCGYLVALGWRWCFIVPAILAGACAVGVWFYLPDTPQSVGLPEVAGTETGEETDKSRAGFLKYLREHVFENKFIWIVSIANFFVYTLRYAVFDWGPTFLSEYRHIKLSHGAWMVAAFEFSGLLGALGSGWLTDRFFGGRPMRAGTFFMALAGVSLWMFWKIVGESALWNTALLCASGFFIYGPQCLIGIAAANLATKRAAATAVGLTGFFGYLSTVLSGAGLGFLVEYRGWDAGLAGLLVVAALGTVLFGLAWSIPAHGYGEEK